jgi:ribosomal protein L11 methyltransferase
MQIAGRMRYSPPYKDLYIYYLKGRIGGDPFPNAEDFIGNWEEEEDTFLFFKRPADASVADLLKRESHLTLLDSYQMPYEQWQGDAVVPFCVGSLHVAPPWNAEEARSTRSDEAETLPDPILLDPGVVFGSGTHPTTRDCLEAIQHAFEFQPPRRVLDLGTGTGVLALAAVRLGAKRVLAVDLNRLAVRTAQRNAALNRMTDRLLAVQGNALHFMDVSADLLITNIHYDVMQHLIVQPGFLRYKQFVLSGLLKSQAREIEYSLSSMSFDIARKWDRDGIWYTYYGRCPESD